MDWEVTKSMTRSIVENIWNVGVIRYGGDTVVGGSQRMEACAFCLILRTI